MGDAADDESANDHHTDHVVVPAERRLGGWIGPATNVAAWRGRRP